MIRVLFVAPHPVEGPSSRFRIYQFLPYLRANGVHAEVRPFVSSRHVQALYQSGGIARKVALTGFATLNRAMDVLRATRYDVVYVLREAFPFGPPLFERALAAAGGRLVFDFDDAIWLPSQVYDNPLDRARDWGKPAKLVARARHVVVGSRYLADFAEKYAVHPDAISIIPTVVDSTVYKPSNKTREDGSLTIGWVGTPRGSRAFLETLVPVMRDFAVRYPHVRWRFVGAEPFDVGSLPVEFKTWRLADEVADIQSFDIGLMPLTDDPYTRGKCGFKLIQYMNCGMPVVCSPVGANRDIVQHGLCGYFADDVAQWSDALARLIEDSSLRNAMGAHGRTLAEERYSLAAQAPRLLEVIRAVAQPSGARNYSSPSGKTTF